LEALERLTISEALRTAKQQTADAQKAKDAGDPQGQESASTVGSELIIDGGLGL
jgi:hypothetical protein